MHVARIFIQETGLKVSQPNEDLKRFYNLAIQVYGMGSGDKIRIWGSIIEHPTQRWVPVKICKLGYDIIQDGIYIIPSQYVYYKFAIVSRGTSNPIDASVYATREGEFPQCLDLEGTSLEVTIPIAKETQDSKFVKDFSLTDSMVDISALQFNISSGEKVYLSDLNFSIIGSAAEVEVVYVPSVGAEVLLEPYSLTAFNPTVIDSKSDPIKIRANDSLVGTIKVRAKKFCRYDTDLNGKITIIRSI